MRKDEYGQLIFGENDLCDLLMKGNDLDQFTEIIIEPDIQTEKIREVDPAIKSLFTYQNPDTSVQDFDLKNQSNWHMPQEYRDLDIAEYVLSLCSSQEELQRCGKELLLYQQKDLFNLLCYLKYLVDVMTQNGIIWGVGRGSSVSSYVLYKIGVHKIDSMYYDLDPEEFLR